MSVFESILKRGDSLEIDPSKGSFRQFLSTVCHRRVVDYIRGLKERHPTEASSDSSSQQAVQREEAAALDDFDGREEQAFRNALLGTMLAVLHEEVSPQVYLIFERVKLAGESPADVAVQLDVKRGVVDNSIYKAIQKLREIGERPEISREF